MFVCSLVFNLTYVVKSASSDKTGKKRKSLNEEKQDYSPLCFDRFLLVSVTIVDCVNNVFVLFSMVFNIEKIVL